MGGDAIRRKRRHRRRCSGHVLAGQTHADRSNTLGLFLKQPSDWANRSRLRAAEAQRPALSRPVTDQRACLIVANTAMFRRRATRIALADTPRAFACLFRAQRLLPVHSRRWAKGLRGCHTHAYGRAEQRARTIARAASWISAVMSIPLGNTTPSRSGGYRDAMPVTGMVTLDGVILSP